MNDKFRLLSPVRAYNEELLRCASGNSSIRRFIYVTRERRNPSLAHQVALHAKLEEGTRTTFLFHESRSCISSSVWSLKKLACTIRFYIWFPLLTALSIALYLHRPRYGNTSGLGDSMFAFKCIRRSSGILWFAAACNQSRGPTSSKSPPKASRRR